MSHAVLMFWHLILHLWLLIHHHTHAIRKAIGDNATFRLLRRAVDILLHKAIGTV